MGQQCRSESLFYYFRIEDHVPEHHLLRAIDRYVNFDFVRQRLKTYYSDTGRPSIDPERLLRIMLIGYLYGVGVEATVASSSQEVISARTMVADCAEKFGLAPKTLAADAGYGKADFLTWLENRGITPYIPLRLHYPSGNQLYGLDRFTYQPETNSFECPEGKQLKYRGIKPAANRSHIYRSTEAQCRDCLRKTECTSGRYKQLVIHVDEEVRQRARERNQKPEYFRHQRSRKKIEALFGELKNRICLRRARLRRLKHVREQFLMAATAQNLKRLVRFLASMPPAKDQLRNKSASRSLRPVERCRIRIAPPRRRRLFQQLLLKWTPVGHSLPVKMETPNAYPKQIRALKLEFGGRSGYGFSSHQRVEPFPGTSRQNQGCSSNVGLGSLAESSVADNLFKVVSQTLGSPRQSPWLV